MWALKAIAWGMDTAHSKAQKIQHGRQGRRQSIQRRRKGYGRQAQGLSARAAYESGRQAGRQRGRVNGRRQAIAAGRAGKKGFCGFVMLYHQEAWFCD